MCTNNRDTNYLTRPRTKARRMLVTDHAQYTSLCHQTTLSHSLVQDVKHEQ